VNDDLAAVDGSLQAQGRSLQSTIPPKVSTYETKYACDLSLVAALPSGVLSIL
jgi:hypothetical protein